MMSTMWMPLQDTLRATFFSFLPSDLAWEVKITGHYFLETIQEYLYLSCICWQRGQPSMLSTWMIVTCYWSAFHLTPSLMCSFADSTKKEKKKKKKENTKDIKFYKLSSWPPVHAKRSHKHVKDHAAIVRIWQIIKLQTLKETRMHGNHVKHSESAQEWRIMLHKTTKSNQ